MSSSLTSQVRIDDPCLRIALPETRRNAHCPFAGAREKARQRLCTPWEQTIQIAIELFTHAVESSIMISYSSETALFDGLWNTGACSLGRGGMRRRHGSAFSAAIQWI